MAKIIGIDEAGRGPVIGPLVISGIIIDKKHEPLLAKWGVRDSKLLTTEKRNAIAKKLREFKHHVEIIHPLEIDKSTNINYLEAIKTAMIINKLNENIEEEIEVIVDCPSVNIKLWKRYVERFIIKKSNINLVCAHKADKNFLAVAAASIISKEKREEEISKIKKEFGANFNSGYASDPETLQFIEQNINNPRFLEIIRFSWKTVKDIRKNKEQRKLF